MSGAIRSRRAWAPVDGDVVEIVLRNRGFGVRDEFERMDQAHALGDIAVRIAEIGLADGDLDGVGQAGCATRFPQGRWGVGHHHVDLRGRVARRAGGGERYRLERVLVRRLTGLLRYPGSVDLLNSIPMAFVLQDSERTSIGQVDAGRQHTFVEGEGGGFVAAAVDRGAPQQRAVRALLAARGDELDERAAGHAQAQVALGRQALGVEPHAGFADDLRVASIRARERRLREIDKVLGRQRRARASQRRGGQGRRQQDGPVAHWGRPPHLNLQATQAPSFFCEQ